MGEYQKYSNWLYKTRIVVKNIKFFDENVKNIILMIKHGTNNFTGSNDFILPYNKKLSINFTAIDEEITLGEFNINPIVKNNLFFYKTTLELDIVKNNKKIGKITIEQSIYTWFESLLFKYIGYPKTSKTELCNSIKIIKNDFHDQESIYEYYSDAFLRIINFRENIPPLYFGIIAPDNFGKSDLLSILKNKIISSSFIKKIVIEFNPWSFEADDTIWASILMSIHSGLEKEFGRNTLNWMRIKKNFFPDYKSVCLFFIKLIITTGLGITRLFNNYTNDTTSNVLITFFLSLSFLILLKDIFSVVKNFIFSLSDLLKKIKKPDWSKELGFMNEIKTEFFDFINPVIKDNDYKLILLIDDLDKCSIEKIYLVIKVLSLIKYSDCPIYVFLTYDSKKIDESLRNYYQIKYHKNITDSKYIMNKLINVPFCLPGREIINNLSLIYDNMNKSPKIESSPRISPKKRKDTILDNFNIDLDDLNIETHLDSLYQSREITTFQSIIENTKNSGNALTNEQVIKIINIYSLAKFLLPNNLRHKRFILLHLIVLCENWLRIMIYLYKLIRKTKFNLTYSEIKEAFGEKQLLFFYLNDTETPNDELLLYLTKFEIKIIDFIDLEPYIFNLDRCL
jgi:hypothetical protein